jgi:MATE family multidrug resistance protein
LCLREFFVTASTHSPRPGPTLPWLDRPLRELVRLSWPVTVSMLSFTLMTLIDALLVARLGKDALAGVGLGGTVAFTMISFGWGLVRGGKTLVAQAFGANRPREAGGYLGAAMLAGVIFGLIAFACTWPIAWGLQRVVATRAEGQAFFTYLMIRSLGGPANLVFAALREVRYGQGDSRSPMVASIVANLCNAILAYLLIFPAGLGVAGAAWATVVAQTLEALVLALAQHRAGWGVSAMTRAHLLALLRMGVPGGLQASLEVGAFAVLAAMVAAMSSAQMAAHQITLQMISFSFMPGYAIGEGAAVMVGQVVGAGRDDLVLPVARVAVRVAGVYTALCTLVFVGLTPQLIDAFHVDDETRTIAITLLRVSGLFLVMDGANMVARATLRGTGDVKFPAWIGVLCSWCMTPPLAWLLGYHYGLGAFGGWLGLSGEVFLGAGLQWLRLRQGGWRRHAERTRSEVVALAGG